MIKKLCRFLAFLISKYKDSVNLKKKDGFSYVSTPSSFQPRASWFFFLPWSFTIYDIFSSGKPKISIQRYFIASQKLIKKKRTAGYESQMFNLRKIPLYTKIDGEEVMSICNWKLESSSAFENGTRAVVRTSSPA